MISPPSPPILIEYEHFLGVLVPKSTSMPIRGLAFNDVWRAIAALGLLVALSASADAASAHRRHVTVNPNQGYSERAISGYAYAPDGPVIHDQFESTRPSVYDNKYKNWGG